MSLARWPPGSTLRVWVFGGEASRLGCFGFGVNLVISVWAEEERNVRQLATLVVGVGCLLAMRPFLEGRGKSRATV